MINIKRMCLRSVAMTCWSVETQAIFFPHMTDIQRKELCKGDFKRLLFKTGLRWEVYELISFKFGMMIDMSIVYILLPV